MSWWQFNCHWWPVIKTRLLLLYNVLDVLISFFKQFSIIQLETYSCHNHTFVTPLSKLIKHRWVLSWQIVICEGDQCYNTNGYLSDTLLSLWSHYNSFEVSVTVNGNQMKPTGTRSPKGLQRVGYWLDTRIIVPEMTARIICPLDV